MMQLNYFKITLNFSYYLLINYICVMSAKRFLQHCYGGRIENSYITNSFMENRREMCWPHVKWLQIKRTGLEPQSRSVLCSGTKI